MKKILIIVAIAALAFFLSVQANACDAEHTSAAIMHLEKAQAHGEAGHADMLLKHAKKSLMILESAKVAEKEHSEAHKHMYDAIVSLEEAIKLAEHGEAADAKKAAKLTERAIRHMHESALLRSCE